MRVPALFLDRDGIVNEDDGYVHSVEQFRFVEAVFDLCRAAREAGLVRIVIVTNQAGIGRGLYSEADYQAVTGHMLAGFARENIRIDAVYHAPWHPEAARPDYRRDHPWRKPGPGMILAALEALAIEAADSVLIGDRETDIAAARAAGLGTAIMIGDREPATAADLRLPDVAAAAGWLRSRRR